MEYIFGGVAGASATIFSNPFDVVKTRLQLQGELRARGEHKVLYRGVFHAIYVVGRNEGIFALQKGLLSAMIFGFAMNSVRLGIYRVAEKKNWTKDENGDIKLGKTLVVACVSGVAGGIAGNPFSIMKTRLQASAHPDIAVGHQHRYTGTWDAAKTIYKAHGIAGFFSGVWATISRLAVGSTAQLTTFSVSKNFLYNHGVCRNSPFMLAFCASACSGVCIAIAICPLDVTNTRLFNQDSGGGRLYTGVFDCLKKTYLAEGLYGLYKGFGPLYLRIAPHTTLTLVIWDRLNSLIK